MKLEGVFIVLYLVMVAVISVYFAVITLHMPARQHCKGAEFRPDLSPDQREWCRRRPL